MQIVTKWTREAREINDKISVYIWKHTSRETLGDKELVRPVEIERNLKLNHRIVFKHLNTLEAKGTIKKEAIYSEQERIVLKGYRWADSHPPLVSTLPDEIRLMVEGVAKGDFISYACMPAIEAEHPKKITLKDAEEAFKKRIGAVFYYAKPDINTKLVSVAYPAEKEFIHNNPFWLQYIFRYALRERLIDEKYFTGKEEIKGDDLDSMWTDIFDETRLFLIVFTINPKKLLDFLKTNGGKNYLRQALTDEVKRDLYIEAIELWKQREEFNKKLKPLKIHYEPK